MIEQKGAEWDQHFEEEAQAHFPEAEEEMGSENKKTEQTFSKSLRSFSSESVESHVSSFDVAANQTTNKKTRKRRKICLIRRVVKKRPANLKILLEIASPGHESLNKNNRRKRKAKDLKSKKKNILTPCFFDFQRFFTSFQHSLTLFQRQHAEAFSNAASRPGAVFPNKKQ